MIRGKILGLLVLLLIGQAVAVLPPEERAKRCAKTGGQWVDSSCQCPDDATSLWSRCWEKTPREICEIMGGTEEQKQVVGPEGSSFVCKKNGQDITEETWDKATLYNKSQQTTTSTTQRKNISWQTYVPAIILILVLTATIFILNRKRQ